MFRNLTLAQQMFFFVLAVFLILLVFRILVKLKLAPVLLYAACANLIFPEWVAEQKALYWAILAGLVLVTIFRWVGPRLTAHMEEQRIMREIVEQSRARRPWGIGMTRLVLRSRKALRKSKSGSKATGGWAASSSPCCFAESPLKLRGLFIGRTILAQYARHPLPGQPTPAY